MTTTTAGDITDEQRLTMLKHLNSGKNLDQVATITGKPRALVLDVVSKHGYPHSLPKGIDVLTKKIERDRGVGTAPTRTPGQVETAVDEDLEPAPLPRPRPATTSPSSVTSPDARPVGAPDEIRVLLNAGKQHTSKRIQAQADRVFDALGKLRDMLAADAEKNAAKRAEDAAKTAARAEVERLEKALAAARAKLRGPKPVATVIEVGSDVTAAELRAWARDRGIDVPPSGRVPAHIREQYDAGHREDGAA